MGEYKNVHELGPVRLWARLASVGAKKSAVRESARKALAPGRDLARRRRQDLCVSYMAEAGGQVSSADSEEERRS